MENVFFSLHIPLGDIFHSSRSGISTTKSTVNISLFIILSPFSTELYKAESQSAQLSHRCLYLSPPSRPSSFFRFKAPTRNPFNFYFKSIASDSHSLIGVTPYLLKKLAEEKLSPTSMVIFPGRITFKVAWSARTGFCSMLCGRVTGTKVVSLLLGLEGLRCQYVRVW